MSKKTAIKNLKALTNEDFLEAVSAVEPKYKETAAKLQQDFFAEKGYQAVSAMPGGVTEFYAIAALVGAQFVDFISGRNVLDKMGILERFRMDLGAYAQRNRIKRIHNVDPAYIGLKNGDSPDQFEVRKPEIIQDYYGLNLNYSNWFTWLDYDLKGGWMRSDGIGETLSLMFSAVALDRKENEFSLFFEVINGALNSSEHPLRDTQVIELDSWSSTVTEAEVRKFIKVVKNVAEAFETAPTFDAFNAAGAINDADVSDHVMLVRIGVKSEIEDVLGYAFNDEKLNLPFDIYPVNNFGGLIPKDANDNALQEVFDKNGVKVGYIDAAATVNGRATQRADGQWIVNITSGGTTADTTILESADHYEDPNEDVIALICQRGVVFELIQNDMISEPARNSRVPYTNQWFNELNNGINYNHTRNLIPIKKPSA